MFNEGNQIHNFMCSSGSRTVINYGSGSDFLTSYGSGYVSGSTSQKVTVPMVPVVPVPVPVPVPQHCREQTPSQKRNATYHNFTKLNDWRFLLARINRAISDWSLSLAVYSL